MPLYVNLPGGRFDTAGRGVAAAQQYRGNEQQMDLRQKSFDMESDLAVRKLQLEEQQLQFQQEELASQQAAGADYIIAERMRNGEFVSPEQQRALRALSPDMQERVLYGMAQDRRLKAEGAALDRATMDLDTLEQTGNVANEIGNLRAQMEVGAITPQQFVSAVASLKKKSATIDHRKQLYEVVRGNVDAWAGDPTRDLPTEDDDAYDDVMELFQVLSPNAPFDPSVDYEMAWNQYKFLTTKGMREASRALLQADMDKQGIKTIDAKLLDAMLESASKDPAFQHKAEMLRSSVSGMDPFNVLGWRARGGGSAAPAQPAAPQASAPQAPPQAQKPTTGGRGIGPDMARSLTAEADRLSPEQEKLGRQALSNLGLDEVPPEGSRLYQRFIKEIADLERDARENPPPLEGEALTAAIEQGRKQKPGLSQVVVGAARAAGRAISDVAPKGQEVVANRQQALRDRTGRSNGTIFDSAKKVIESMRQSVRGPDAAGTQYTTARAIQDALRDAGFTQVPASGTPEKKQYDEIVRRILAAAKAGTEKALNDAEKALTRSRTL